MWFDEDSELLKKSYFISFTNQFGSFIVGYSKTGSMWGDVV